MMSRPHSPDPAWFGAVMGTGATAIVIGGNPTAWAALTSPLRILGIALFTIAALLLVWLLVLHFVVHDLHRTAPERWRSPTRGPALATIPGGLNVVALAVIALFPGAAGTTAGWWLLLTAGTIATLLGIGLTFGFFSQTFWSEHLDIREISGVWFIPETVLLLGSLLFSKLTRTGPEVAQRSLTVIALMLLGAGSVLFALTAAGFFYRLIVAGPGRATGPMWIMLSPLSVLCLAMQYAAADTDTLGGIWDASVRSTADFLAALSWGFAIWWIGPAVVITAKSAGTAISRAPSDWGYVFPAAALSLATSTLATAWESGLIRAIAIVLSTAALTAWVAVSYLSVSELIKSRSPG